jgi:uncharacterized Zn finger protein
MPQDVADVGAKCTCPDWENPRKHAAATLYVIGEALDRDPFLLFELRGRTKEQVLEELRAARASNGGPPMRRAADITSIDIGQIDASDYDRPRSALPALHLSFEPPATSGLLLKQLGVPPAWSHEASPADTHAPEGALVPSLRTRLCVGPLDKVIEVVGDRG